MLNALILIILSVSSFIADEKKFDIVYFINTSINSHRYDMIFIIIYKSRIKYSIVRVYACI